MAIHKITFNNIKGKLVSILKNSKMKSWSYWIAGIFGGLGLVILIVTIIKLWIVGHVFWNDDIDFESTGQKGDFIGGLVGSLWTLVGVILFFMAVRLQSDELTNTRQVLSYKRNLALEGNSD